MRKYICDRCKKELPSSLSPGPPIHFGVDNVLVINAFDCKEPIDLCDDCMGSLRRTIAIWAKNE